VFVICLLAATAVAFAVTENLKLDESSPISRTRITALFSPVCKAACPASGRSALIGFRLRREEDIRLDIVDSSGNVVRGSLVSQVLPAVFREFAWDGRDASGRLVPDGVYRARITLADEGRTITFPDEIRVDATSPTVEDVKVKHAVFSPDGDGRADHASLVYRFSEPAYPVLYVDGHALPHGRNKRSVGAYPWYGKGLRLGTHRLALAAQDLAGNLGTSTREFTVQIRYVALGQRRYRALAGHRLRIRVSTDATELRYVLAGPGPRIASSVRAKRAVRSFVLRVPLTPGRYRLTVTVHGRSARALVLVRLG
jgi:flagellar hook capping protein FlgD